MINLDKTEEIIQKNFPDQDVTKFKDQNVFKCVKKHRDTPYEVLYIDCENVWVEKEFDLESYQENYLLNDFYTSNNHLQWNYYFIFLGDKNQINKNESRKENIERDQIYSRKFVMSPEDLEEWLYQTQEISASSKSGFQKDLSSQWINFLKNSDLDCIHLKDVSYKKGVQKYLEGNPIEDETVGDTNSSSTAERINKIDKLYLKNYREFPKKKEYNFGQVNLINGVNGSGKTSLLESLEFLLCGESYRNPDEEKSEYKIEGLISNSKKLIKFSLDDISVYKDRDAYWYHNPYHRGSIKTHLNFKKYNFFNSDAAFELSNDPDSYNIKEAFEDMALGEKVNLIERKLEGYLERFDRELRSYKKDINQYEERIKKEEKILDELSDSDKNPERLFEEFKKECKNSGWQIDETLGRKKLLTNFEKNYSDADQILNSIEVKLIWVEDITQENIEEITTNYRESLKRIDEINESLSELKSDIERFLKDESALLSLQEKLENLSEYYAQDNINNLIGIDDKVTEISRDVDKYSQIEKLLEDISFEFLEDKSGYLHEYEEYLAQETRNLREEKKEIRTKIKSVRKGIDLLEEIISDIKSKGKQFINNNPDSKECPLCHTKFKEDKLNERINKAHTEFKESEFLEHLIKEENELNEKINMLEEKDKNLSSIKEISFLIHGDNYAEISIQDLLHSLSETPERLKEAKARLDEVKSIRQKFENNGLSEEEYQDLLEYVNDKEWPTTNKKEAAENLLEIEKELRALETKKAKKIEKQEELKTEREDVLNENASLKNNDEETLRNQYKELKASLKLFDNLREHIEFKEGVEIIELESKISALYNLSKRTNELYNEKAQNDIKRKSTNDNIKELKQKKDNAQKIKNRAQEASDSINYIFNNYSKSEFLKTFFKNNKNEIADTFKMIHAPREFNSLDFSEENGTSVKLTRSRNGKGVTLNQISSGQRSALALSIFLTLHKQLDNGPDLMLFDDPITSIDDLNTLSFLDYLRELVINSDRQVFFATANGDLANLFEKKFSFLGEKDFKKFELARN